MVPAANIVVLRRPVSVSVERQLRHKAVAAWDARENGCAVVAHFDHSRQTVRQHQCGDLRLSGKIDARNGSDLRRIVSNRRSSGDEKIVFVRRQCDIFGNARADDGIDTIDRQFRRIGCQIDNPDSIEVIGDISRRPIGGDQTVFNRKRAHFGILRNVDGSQK
jgi:hypothetical protein